MNHLNKKQIAFIAAAVSVPVMMFFQNCSQAKLNVTDASSQARSEGVIYLDQVSDFLIINPPQTESDVTVDASSQNSAQVQQPPSVPPQTSSSAASNDKSQAVVISQQPPVDPVEVAPPAAPPEAAPPEKCAALHVSDVLLKVDSISVTSGDESQYKVSFEFVDADHSISLNKSSLKIKALSSFKAKHIFLKLAGAGNQILTSNNQAMDLKIPSGLSSGVKVALSQEFEVRAGQIFNLQLAINPIDQFVENPEKCIFKPVIQVAHLALISGVSEPSASTRTIVPLPPVDASGNE